MIRRWSYSFLLSFFICKLDASQPNNIKTHFDVTFPPLPKSQASGQFEALDEPSSSGQFEALDEPSICVPNPCHNNGLCIPVGSVHTDTLRARDRRLYDCECPVKFYGHDCQRRRKEKNVRNFKDVQPIPDEDIAISEQEEKKKNQKNKDARLLTTILVTGMVAIGVLTAVSIMLLIIVNHRVRRKPPGGANAGTSVSSSWYYDRRGSEIPGANARYALPELCSQVTVGIEDITVDETISETISAKTEKKGKKHRHKHEKSFVVLAKD